MDAHHLQLPSGHKRFQYNRDVDGCYRIQTVRYETTDDNEIETAFVEESILPDKKYSLKIIQDSSIRVEVRINYFYSCLLMQ